MPVLENGQHELFAQKWHETENKSDGYRYAYPNSLKWKDESVHNKASALSKVSEVAARYNELKQELAENHGITVESLLVELEEIKLKAMGAETPQCSAAVSSVMSKAKLVGLDVTKVEISSQESLTPWDKISIGVATAVEDKEE